LIKLIGPVLCLVLISQSLMHSWVFVVGSRWETAGKWCCWRTGIFIRASSLWDGSDGNVCNLKL